MLRKLHVSIIRSVQGHCADRCRREGSQRQVCPPQRCQPVHHHRHSDSVSRVVSGIEMAGLGDCDACRQDPKNWTSLNNTFYKVADDVFEQSPAIYNVQLVPNNIIVRWEGRVNRQHACTCPFTVPYLFCALSVIPITGFNKAVALDLMNSKFRTATYNTMMARGNVLVDGPTMLVIVSCLTSRDFTHASVEISLRNE